MVDINVSIFNMGKAYQDYISIDGTLLLGIIKHHLLILESYYHSRKYLSSTSMIICLVQLANTSAIIDPCWYTSFYWNASACNDVHSYYELLEPSAYSNILSTISYGVCTSISSLFDKFILHIFRFDARKDI